jgi:hypothetical protein
LRALRRRGEYKGDEVLIGDPEASQVQLTSILNGDFGTDSSSGEVKLTLGMPVNTGLALFTRALFPKKSGGMRDFKDPLMLKRLDGRLDSVVASSASSSGILVLEREGERSYGSVGC